MSADDEDKERGGARGPKTSKAYEVGHGKPPRSTQFQPGESGNPSGRPRAMATSPGIVVERTFNQKVSIFIDGRRRRVSLFEAMVMQVLKEAAGGDAKARRDLLKIASEFGYRPPPLPLSSLLEAWVEYDGGKIPKPDLRWMFDLDRLGEALIRAALVAPTDDGAVRISPVLFEQLLATPMPAARRRALRAALRPFLTGAYVSRTKAMTPLQATDPKRRRR
jgi:uncharacterized protein DUF5681